MLWDIFCRVIDNHGDLGVCWRLSADLASRGHHIRLWVDDASALTWMAPQAKLNPQGWAQLQVAQGHVQVRPWSAALTQTDSPSGVWIEAFGCDLPHHFLQWAAVHSELATPVQTHLQTHLQTPVQTPVWLNLEYLSAESYVERSHKLPSPVMSGPLKGRTKWFFYPGFTNLTGGLIREAHITGLAEPHKAKVLADLSAPKLTSLFCYEPAALKEALQLKSLNLPNHVWQVAHGRGAVAFDQAYAQIPSTLRPRFEKLPSMTQTQFDALLSSCDLNFVRGEDSLVRALWAGKPFIWHIYPQDDGAHGPKLKAFLDWLQAPESLRLFHLCWNGLTDAPLPEIDLKAWQTCIQAAKARLLAQSDLVSQLLQFVAEKR
jgi:uncharacterized repeat protein (TIGR03837 family)